MRFNNIDIITFIDIDGNRKPVRDLRPIPTFKTIQKVSVEKDMDIDDLISRQDFYGDGAEQLAYAVVENNIVQFVESEFDLTKIKNIDMPLIEEF